jgi:prepilin-type N-terminal cleavage/methylation domain-containing protein
VTAMAPRSAKEDGFTLVELLLAVVLVSVITLAVGDALIGFTRNTDATIHRLAESHDAQISAAYFAQDVASIGIRDSDEALEQSVETRSKSKALACGVPPGHLVVRLGWDDPTTATQATQVLVSYVVEVVAGQRQMHRLVCSPSHGTLSDTIVVHYLGATLPVVTCTDAKAQPTPCDGSAADVPQSVSMALSLDHVGDPGPAYTVTLTGTRRQTASVTPPQQVLQLLR